jgi:hypothetical protein
VVWKLAQSKPLPLASVLEELAAWAIVEEAKEVIKQESGEQTLAAPAFQGMISEYFKDTHFLSLFEEREGSPVREVTTTGDWLCPKSVSPTHIPHPYVWNGKTGTNLGRAYKKWLSRTARDALAAGLDLLIDELFEDFTNPESGDLVDMAGATLAWHLPMHYLPKYSRAFQKQFTVCILTVAWKLAQPKSLLLSSVAEELAAWAILTAAKQHVELMQEEEEGYGMQNAEQMFDDFVELFFEDEDFLFLFDECYDGIDTSEVGQMLHMTSLAFADWFKPFNDDPSRRAHPYVTGGF